MSYYEQSGANIVRPENFVLSFRLRVPYDYSGYPEIRSGTMFNANLGDNVGITFGIANDEIYFLNTENTMRGGTAFVDTGRAFHDYLLVIHTPTRQFTFHQDGIQVLSGITPGYGNSPPSIWWGDGTQYAGGLGIWQTFEHNAAAVPEPASLAALVIGALILARKRAN
ncbi:MAG TPA: PEP-CTERM sorting domain-containing protein [Fimbriimonadaceae bacterium]|nr:PEP-CTERM sorting domain-containing protein [Fimbriimonadaceae bacterium]